MTNLFGPGYKYKPLAWDRIPPLKRIPGQPKRVHWDPDLGRYVIYRSA